MFYWPRSASTARSQVWLGLPNGRFQSGGSPQITAATARWWSSCGELWAVCLKNCKSLSVTGWERGWHPMVALTSTFITWRVYGILRILQSAHNVKCINARVLELCGGPCFAPIQQDRDYVSLVEAYFDRQTDRHKCYFIAMSYWCRTKTESSSRSSGPELGGCSLDIISSFIPRFNVILLVYIVCS